MKEEEIEKFRKAADEGTIPDNENPIFIFHTTSTVLLVKAINHEFDLLDLAKRELSDRGLNQKGEWIGFMRKPLLKKPVQKKGKGLK